MQNKEFQVGSDPAGWYQAGGLSSLSDMFNDVE